MIVTILTIIINISAKITKAGFTHIRCVKTEKVLPLSDFRIHKSGYYFSYCKKWEALQAKIRREKKKKND